jgi:hypothetical protein
VHGGSGEALKRGGQMEEEMEKGKKKDSMDPIMMEEEQIKQIMTTFVNTWSGVPYQYKMNNNKRAIDDIEGLASDDEEVGISGLWSILRKSCVQNMKGRQMVQGRE